MIVCSCAVITSQDIERAIEWMRAADPDTIITPGKVYRALGKRADCGGCVPLFVATMRAARGTPVPSDVPPGLRGLGTSSERRRNAENGGPEGQPEPRS